MTEKVYVAEFCKITDRLLVHELEAKPWGEYDVSLDRAISALGHRQRVAKNRVHASPPAALEAYLAALKLGIESTERKLQAAREQLAESEAAIGAGAVPILSRVKKS